MVVFGILITLISGVVSQSPSFVLVVTVVFYPLAMWLAVKYSARYLDKTYIISNAKQVVILSTVYIIIVGGGFRVAGVISEGSITIEHFAFFLAIIAFYFASKKYIKENSPQVS